MTEESKPDDDPFRIGGPAWVRGALRLFDLPGGEHLKTALLGRSAGEEAVRQMVLWSCAMAGANGMLRGTPYRPGDVVSREYRLTSGAVDLVVWHADALVTLIEVKDGDQGRAAVLAGIGQVCAYEVMARSMGLSVACRALLWSCSGGVDNDLVAESCRLAGVAPLVGLGRRGAKDVVTEFARKNMHNIARDRLGQKQREEAAHGAS